MSASRSPLLEKARRGEPVSLIDKIETIRCLKELAAIRWAAETYGPPLTPEERDALARRKVDLTYGGRRR